MDQVERPPASSGPRAWASTSSPRRRPTSRRPSSPSSATASSTRCGPSRPTTPTRCARPPAPSPMTEPLRRGARRSPRWASARRFVTVLSPKGVPTPLAATRLLPPDSLMAPLSAPEIASVVAASPLAARYSQAVDRESAHEIITARLANAHAAAATAAARRGSRPGVRTGNRRRSRPDDPSPAAARDRPAGPPAGDGAPRGRAGAEGPGARAARGRAATAGDDADGDAHRRPGGHVPCRPVPDPWRVRDDLRERQEPLTASTSSRRIPRPNRWATEDMAELREIMVLAWPPAGD